MTKLIAVVFDDEKSAYEGSRTLMGLDAEGSIAVYAGAVVAKDAEGKVNVKEGGDEGPIGTLGGMLFGGLIGALAGPQGMLVGAAAGTLGGWLGDMYNLGVDGQFLDDVSTALSPGKCAVVAEVSEGWTTPLDTRMEELGGTVHRRWRVDVEDAQIERDLEATEQELEELEAEWDQAVGEAKEKLKTKVDAARAQLDELKAKATKKVNALNAEAEAKVKKLNEQVAKATGDAKAQFEKRRDELKADYEKRAAKLKEAAALAKSAIA